MHRRSSWLASRSNLKYKTKSGLKNIRNKFRKSIRDNWWMRRNSETKTNYARARNQLHYLREIVSWSSKKSKKKRCHCLTRLAVVQLQISQSRRTSIIFGILLKWKRTVKGSRRSFRRSCRPNNKRKAKLVCLLIKRIKMKNGTNKKFRNQPRPPNLTRTC